MLVMSVNIVTRPVSPVHPVSVSQLLIFLTSEFLVVLSLSVSLSLRLSDSPFLSLSVTKFSVPKPNGLRGSPFLRISEM
jgi:hypothetical protein